jgi:hypothetical protein
MALMQDDSRELLRESGVVDAEAEEEPSMMASPETRSSSGSWKKRWLAVSLAIFVVAYGGMAALLHTSTRAPAATKRGATPSTLNDVLYMEERQHACDTLFDLTAVTHRNLGGVGPDSGHEGLILEGSFLHGTDPPVPLEIHFHALTEYRLPRTQHSKAGNIRAFRTPPGNMALIRLGEARESKFNVELVVPGGHDLYTVPQLAFTFFDVDGPDPGCEEITVEPANDIVMAQDMAVNVDLSRREEGIVKFSNTPGAASLPSRIDRFASDSQRRHAAESVFYHVNNFNMTLHTGSCGDRDFAFIGRANVQCAGDANGGDPPPVDIQTAAPPPVIIETSHVQYCLLCWIHASLNFIPPCSDTEAWWARICE